jgi:nucleoside transporter
VAGLIIGWMAWEPASELVKAGTAENATTAANDALKTAASKLNITFLICAAMAAAVGVYSFFLPNTPPPKAGKNVAVSEVLGLDAIKILKDKNYLLFFIASVLICIPLAFYYGSANQFLNEAGVEKAAAKMTMGQMSETLFLFLMPLFFKRFGIKQMLLIGMLAWVLRYFLFAYGNSGSGLWMLYLGIILHGICYDFFFVTGQIYTDKKAGDNVRSAAQGLITLATYGVGMYIGFWLAGKYADVHAIKDAAGKVVNHHWQTIWIFPCLFAAGVALLFLLFFKNDKKTAL